MKGSELGKLEEIVLRKGTVKRLIELLKTVLEKELNSMILMILEIFIHLSNEPKFYSYFQIENPMPLLDSALLRENKNEEIKNKANSLFESVIKNDSQKYSSIAKEEAEGMNNIEDASVDKQLEYLSEFEDDTEQISPRLKIMRSLAKSKVEKVKERLHKYILSQLNIHKKLQENDKEHRRSIFQFYLEYYKHSYELIKNNEEIRNMMFDMCRTILSDKDLPSEDLKNVIDYCTFIFKKAEEEKQPDADNSLTIEHLRTLGVVTLLIKLLKTGKYEKRVYALKIIINFMEISNLDEALLRENHYELFDLLLHFTQSELQEERRLATRGLSKLPLHILEERNPKIMPQVQESNAFPGIEAIAQHIGGEQERKTIKEDSSEASMSRKSSDESDSDLNRAASGTDQSVSNKDNDGKSDDEEEKKESKSVSKQSHHSQTDSDETSSDDSVAQIGSKGNIHSLISSLSMQIKPRNNADSDIQYFALYSIFNLLLQTNINHPDRKALREEAKQESIPKDQKHWNDLSTKEFNMMLIDCHLINNVISLLVKAKDEDVIRISLKIIILITFKVPIKDFMNFDSSGTDKFWLMSWMSNDSESYNYYNFQSFLGYILHRAEKESIDITSFMPLDSINNFIMKLCNDFREDELLELNSKGNNSKKKMIIYKFFFVSYLISLLTRTLTQKYNKIEIDIRLGINKLCYNFIEICQGVKIPDLGLPKLLQNVEEKKNPVNNAGRSSITGVIVSLCMRTLYVELICSKKNDDNDNNIFDKRVANVLNEDPKEEQLSALHKKICMLILNNLTKYEDVGEIIDLTYKYYCCFFENTSEHIKSEYTELLENSKPLISQGVKHIAVYKWDSALKFMNLMIGSSSKFKNKSEIDNALRNLLNTKRKIQK